MKSYAKLFAVLCAVTLSVSFISGCADKPTTPPPPAPEVVRPNS